MTLSTNTQIALLLSMMVNSVLFGIGAIAVLSIPALAENAKLWLPAVIVASFLLTPIIAWLIAPRLRSRRWRKQNNLTRR